MPIEIKNNLILVLLSANCVGGTISSERTRILNNELSINAQEEVYIVSRKFHKKYRFDRDRLELTKEKSKNRYTKVEVSSQILNTCTIGESVTVLVHPTVPSHKRVKNDVPSNTSGIFRSLFFGVPGLFFLFLLAKNLFKRD